MERINEKTWNDAVDKAGFKATIFQTTYWAEYLRKTYNDRPIYIASVDNKGNRQGLLLAIESCYAKHPALTMIGRRGLILGKIHKYVISPLLHKTLPFIFWENGPIIYSLENQLRRAVYQEILEKIVKEAKKRNCYEIKFVRPALFDDEAEIFSSMSFQKRRMGTILVDLNCSIDDLWNKIDKHARRNVRKQEKELEIVKASTLDKLKEFYYMHVDASKRTKTKIYPFSFYASLWNHFSPCDKIALFIAYHKGKPVGASISLMHNKMIHEFAISDSNYARSNRIYANDCIKWHIIKWAHERDFRYFDLSGVELYKIDVGDEKAQNIFRFKSKWGGQLIEYHDYGKTLKAKKLASFLNHFLADSVLHN